MTVTLIEDFEKLAALSATWDALGRGTPFRSWAWLSGWWSSYRPRGRLWTPVVTNEQGELIGVAPWYMIESKIRGRIVRPLGDGEVCSDYLSILARDEDRDQVASELAAFLADKPDSSSREIRWDAIELPAVDGEDPVVWRLAEQLGERVGILTRRRAAHNCWRVDLPRSWDEYVGRHSKSHRKQLRRLERRVLKADRAVLSRVRSPAELDTAWGVLVDLHQRRRRSLGEAGCFASERFTRFHRRVAELFLARDMLRLYWLELDGRPIAVEYQLAGSTNHGDENIYAYQSGVAPDRLDEEPGRLIMIATIQHAIAEGRQAVDFLRGDEPYKAHWRATPRPAYDVRIVSGHATARVRDGIRHAFGEARSWIKSSRELMGGETT